MPRKPTGRPTGRPKGSGILGEVTRFTLRLPTELYQRLELFAEGRSYVRGTPELSGCVRDLLEHALACPYKRHTKSIPMPSEDSSSQTENIPGMAMDEIQQTIIDHEQSRDEIQQTEIMPSFECDALQQTLSVPTLSLAPAVQRIEQIVRKQVSPTPRPLDATDLDTRPVEPVAISHQPAPLSLPEGYYLGKLCPRRHDYQVEGHPTGQSLLTVKGQRCRLCDAEKKREKRQTQRQAAPVA